MPLSADEPPRRLRRGDRIGRFTVLESLGRGGMGLVLSAYDPCLDLYIAAGRGLAAAHDAGIVHRDFKPDNVLVDRARRAAVRGAPARWP